MITFSKVTIVAIVASLLVVPAASAANSGKPAGFSARFGGGGIGGGAVRTVPVVRAPAVTAGPRAVMKPVASPRIANPVPRARGFGGGYTGSVIKPGVKPGIKPGIKPVAGTPHVPGWKAGSKPGHHAGNVLPGAHHGYGRHHRRHVRPWLYSAPVYYYDGYDASCEWLWRKYLATGNTKWKYRYNDCVE